MSDRQYIFLVFQKNYFGFLFEKKRNWKTWEFESGCSSDEDKGKKYRFV